MLAAEVQKTANDLIKEGHKQFGQKSFDAAQNHVAAKLGQRTPEFVLTVAQRHDSARLIMDLANDDRALDDLAKLPAHRMYDSLVVCEVQSKAYSPLLTQNEPAWRTRDADGYVSKEEWQRTGGEGLSDEAWNKNFDRLAAERSRKVPR